MTVTYKPIGASGPIIHKLEEAAHYLKHARDKVASRRSEKSIELQGLDGVFVRVDYLPNPGCIVMAFVGNDDQDMVAKFDRCGRCCPPWLAQLDPKLQVHKGFANQFHSLIRGHAEPSPLEGTIMRLANHRVPRRILCAGHALGGAIAQLAAVWASARYPTADVRCITFGAPRVGNQEFVTAFFRVVGISYRVVHEMDPTPSHPPIHRSLFLHVHGVMWLSEGKIFLRNRRKLRKNLNPEDGHLSKYLEAVYALARRGSEDGLIHGLNWQHGSGDSNGVMGAHGGVETRPSALADSEQEGGMVATCPDDFEIGAARDTLSHILLIGKIYQAAILAFAAYDPLTKFRDTTGLANAAMLEEGESDVQVYVAWLDAGTAIFAFRGTWNTRDMKVDMDIRVRRLDFMEAIFPDVRVHKGFLSQFKAVTDAVYPLRHIGVLLEKLSGGRVPTRVICTGHSLGGAVSALCASWAAFQFPDADVRCITFGAPRGGNKPFVKAVAYLVGANYRVFHASDPVPSMPPAIIYRHVRGSLCLYRGRLLFKSRPRILWSSFFCGRVRDHFMVPYSNEMECIIGRRLTEERAGIFFSEAGHLATEPDSGEQATATKGGGKAVNPEITPSRAAFAVGAAGQAISDAADHAVDALQQLTSDGLEITTN